MEEKEGSYLYVYESPSGLTNFKTYLKGRSYCWIEWCENVGIF